MEADEILPPAEVEEMAERAEVDEGVRDPRAAVKSKIARLAASHEALRRKVVEVLEKAEANLRVIHEANGDAPAGAMMEESVPSSFEAWRAARDLLSELEGTTDG